jgi:hypothetical protein
MPAPRKRHEPPFVRDAPSRGLTAVSWWLDSSGSICCGAAAGERLAHALQHASI